MGLTFYFLLNQVNFAHAFVKEFGMGDVGVAYPQSASTARYNPGGILDVGNQLDAAGGVLYLNGHVKIENSPIPPLNQRSFTTQFKWLPLGLYGISKQLSPNFAIALSSDTLILSTKGTVPKKLNAFGTSKLGAELLTEFIIPTAAYRLGRHNFGISIPFAISRIKLNGYQNSIPLSIHPNHTTNKGYDWAFGVNLRFGWLYHITDNFSFGASYFTGLLASTRFKKYEGLIPKRGKFEVAPQATVGIAYQFCRGTLSVQATWINFNSCKTISNSVLSKKPFGSENGPSIGFKDTYFIQLGGDYQFLDTLTLRTGYVGFIRPFITKHNILINFIRPSLLLRHAISFGFTQKWGCWDIDFSITQSLKRIVRTSNNPVLVGGDLTGNGIATLMLLGVSIPY